MVTEIMDCALCCYIKVGFFTLQGLQPLAKV